MGARVTTVAFRGIETVEVDVQVHVGGGGWPGSAWSAWPTRR